MNSNTDKNLEVSNWTSPSLYPEYHAAIMMYKVFVPCFLLLGSFGNLATIFVMQRTKDPSSSQHVFLTALAVADFFCLYIVLLPRFLMDYFNVQFWNLHWVTCKLYFWMGYSSTTLSAWLLTAVTVQRTLAVKWPHKIRIMCSVRRTWSLVAGLVIIVCILHSHMLITLGLTVDMGCGFAVDLAGYRFFFLYILTWLTMCTDSFLPFACILVCDVILSLTLFGAIVTMSETSQAIKQVQSALSQDHRREAAWRTSVMVLTLSVAFLVLTMPKSIVVTWYNIHPRQNPESVARMMLVRSITIVMSYANNAANFLLYCFTGSRFRTEFLRWIRCTIQNRPSGSFNET